MENKLWYMNTETGVLTDSHAMAMSWFIDGTNIDLFQNRNGKWIKRGSWER